MTESDILASIRLSLGRLPNVLLFRNNVGGLYDKTGRFVRYGLGVGSPDLIGFTVRDDRAIFTAIEVKAETGVVSPEQKNFIALVRKHGGIAGVARSVEQAKDIINGIVCD